MIAEVLNDGDCCIILMTIKLIMKKTLKLLCHFFDGFVSLFVNCSDLFTDCCFMFLCFLTTLIYAMGFVYREV